MVDSNDKERFGEAKEELARMLQEDELRDAVVLVFANKSDLPGAAPVAQAADSLDLCNMKNRKVFAGTYF